MVFDGSHSLRIATRKSPLALWQANHIRDALMALHPGLTVDLLPMSTEGDRWLDTPLAFEGGKGLFVKALEQALLDGRADIAVHSMKDVPVTFPEGLVLETICKREDPCDALVATKHKTLEELPAKAVVGTASLRRQSQIQHLRPDLLVQPLRGNVNTRLQKLAAGELDAIVLACSGLQRLGLSDKIGQRFDPEVFIPAGGQGVLGIECRRDDPIAELLQPLDDPSTRQCVLAERKVSEILGGNCHVPMGAFAQLSGDTLSLIAVVAALDGAQVLRVAQSGPMAAPEDLGVMVAEGLLAQGAKAILDAAMQSSPPWS